MNVLSVDYGTKRLGLAFGSDGRLSFSKTLTVTGDDDAVERLVQLARKEGIEVFILGLPLRLDGKEKQEAARVRDIAGRISKAARIPVVFIDERLTSKEAELLLREQGVAERELRSKVDALVAKLLLEQYYRERQR